MSGRKREIVKFFAGAVSWEALTHVLIACSGLLPLNVFGITFTPAMNLVQIAVASTVAAVLIYLAWFKHPTSAT